MSPTTRAACFALTLLAGLALAPGAHAQPATLVVTTSLGDAVLSVDGQPLARGQHQLEVAPGQHTVTAELADGRYWDTIVDVGPGARREVVVGPRLDAAPEPEPSGAEDSAPVRGRSRRAAAELELRVPRTTDAAHGELARPDRYPRRRLDRTWGWVGLGVSTALAVTLVALAVETRSLSDEYQQNPTRERLDQGLAFKHATEYGLLPATLGSIALTALAFALSAPVAETP